MNLIQLLLARISWTWKGSWFTAGKDKCLECGVMRKDHQGKDHQFKEEQNAKAN